MSGAGRIDLGIDGRVARVTINHPERRNAVTYAMWKDLGDALEKAGGQDVRVVVLAGEGDQAFCAGNDISEFKDWRHDPEKLAEYNAQSGRVHRLLRNCEKPVIALIRGVCVGGGLELALLCDIRISADNGRFAITPAKLGLGYKLEDIELVVDAIGAGKAKLLLFTGRMFEARAARDLGLVDEVVALDSVEDRVGELAGEIAANAPLTLKALKAAIVEARKPDAARDRARIQALVDACHQSEDFQEGQAAFREKRKPVFRGR